MWLEVASAAMEPGDVTFDEEEEGSVQHKVKQEEQSEESDDEPGTSEASKSVDVDLMAKEMVRTSRLQWASHYHLYVIEPGTDRSLFTYFTYLHFYIFSYPSGKERFS